MNTNFYITLKGFEAHKPKEYPKILERLNLGYGKIIEELKQYQLSQPEILKSYSIAAFNQITEEESRIIEYLKYFDKIHDYKTPDYPEKERLLLTEIISLVEDAKGVITEHLAIYFPEIFKGDQFKIIQEYLPAWNPIRKRLEKTHLFNNSKPEKSDQLSLPKTALIFDSPETLEKVFDSFKGYFPGKEKELLTALKGDKITAPLYWPSDQKQFTEIFRRLKFNGKLITQSTELKDWLCSNFIFEYKKGATREQRPFNPSTVWDYLTKSIGDLAKNKRLESFEWIEYKSHYQNSTNNN